ncbi:hypothetical protein TRFO_02406 [Tritrichomonas foetus]|uniref:SH3 domain-containing protein n=1 Tax=Tritrichomonas foetus TaxID=1144522 RepID=A0A1J4J9G4_9EUKA|nr:hypothetical protein TRFO_02406 [Tritrichomonas foetus]|eukprot:OHS93868.1 hypothetical protein TRFO_02406 [Tritrichomonas foetus]
MRKGLKYGEFHCLSKYIEQVASQVSSALSSFITSLTQFQSNLQYMDSQFKSLNNDLQNVKLSSCFQPTVSMLKKITSVVPSTLFLDKFPPIYQDLLSSQKFYETKYSNIKLQAARMRSTLQDLVKSIQNSVSSLPRSQESAGSPDLHPDLIKFYSNFEEETKNAKSLIITFIDLTNGTTLKITTCVRQSLEPMMHKCSISIPAEVDKVPHSIEKLVETMNEEFNVSNILQKYVIPTLGPVLKTQIAPQQNHCLINYFELENKLNNNAKLKLKREYVYKDNGKEVVLKEGEVVDLIYAGYSRLWSVRTSKKILCYVPSIYLQV